LISFNKESLLEKIGG
jgi:chromosome segregation ATPase